MSVSLFQPLFLTLTLCFYVCWLVIEWGWEEKQSKKGSTHMLQKSSEISRGQGQELMENEEKPFNQTPRTPLYTEAECIGNVMKYRSRNVEKGEKGERNKWLKWIYRLNKWVFEYITTMQFRSAGYIFSFRFRFRCLTTFIASLKPTKNYKTIKSESHQLWLYRRVSL